VADLRAFGRRADYPCAPRKKQNLFARKTISLAPPSKSRKKGGMSCPRLIALLLALVTLVVYLPVTRNGFINYDDGSYVFENQNVQNGLTWAGTQWAFTTWEASNWHPLTWLSHMLDCQLFGLNPAPQHLVNVLFHTANTVLLFILLLRLTGALWPGAMVAALFAWHPLHVESVAWISERKDVLSAFFGLLALMSYAKFVREKCRRSFWLALLFFALGLMSKPMLVTLPGVMLLLDYWPLQRAVGDRWQVKDAWRLVVEKTPFFLLSAMSCVLTFLAQSYGHAVRSLANVPLFYRLENAPVAVMRYLFKVFWPSDLAIVYPMPDFIPASMVAVSAAILVLTTVAVWLARNKTPSLLIGWFWFLGTLLPVIGLVKVGDAALADRYTYLPSIGLFIAIAFGLRDLEGYFQFSKVILPAVAVLVCGACIAITENQLRYWRDTETLFHHALATTRDNADAEINYGVALEQKGLFEDALAHYRAAARIAPGSVQAHNNLGNLLDEMGRPRDAVAEYQQAVRLQPNLPSLHDSLGDVLAGMDRFAEAMNEFTNAARLDHGYPWPHFQMAKALLKQGRDAEAVGQLQAALQISPDNYQILAYFAHVLAAAENPQIQNGPVALQLASKANDLTGGSQPMVLDVLAMAYAALGEFEPARENAQKAVDIATAAQMKNIEPLRLRLELYQNHQPFRQSFTNTPIGEPPKP
jgi:tetratricopeptide (TPR) repeat protein